MKRIDTVNARPDMFGTGKSGFHDNSDISGQDATYMSPTWLNMIQEELCNLLEKNGIAINSNLNDQLFDLLATNTDLIALASKVEDNFLRKTGGTITGNLAVQGLLNAIASSAHKLETGRNIKLSGAVSGDAWFDGSSSINITTTANNAIGVDQSWQDVKANRAPRTTYTNTTGRPIQIFINTNFDDGYITLNGTKYFVADAAAWGWVNLIIPNGNSYAIEGSGDQRILTWLELR